MRVCIRHNEGACKDKQGHMQGRMRVCTKMMGAHARANEGVCKDEQGRVQGQTMAYPMADEGACKDPMRACARANGGVCKGQWGCRHRQE
jgi:hypothetical protein